MITPNHILPQKENNDITNELMIPHYNFSSIPNLECIEYSPREFLFYINKINVLEQFELYNRTTISLSLPLDKNCLKFAWKYIRVLPKFRKNGIMTFVMLNIMQIILKAEESSDVCFYLSNDSIIIDPETPGKGENLKIYDSILTQYDTNNELQYRVFYAQNRTTDLESIQNKLLQIKNHLSMKYPNVGF